MPPQNLFDLKGRIALITGSVRGLGRGIAEGLAEAGAEVILNGRDSTAVARTASEFRSLGLQVREAAFDITDDQAVRDKVAELGPVDILVNNAGLQRRAPFIDYSLTDWSALIETNLTSAFRLCQLVVPGMLARGGGKIINVASLASDYGRPNGVAYSTVKGGIKLMTKALTSELASKNIQVNAIGPGFFLTEFNRALFDDHATNEWVNKRTPAGRWGSPQDLKGCAVFLASQASDFINGQIIFVDGGVSAVL